MSTLFFLENKETDRYGIFVHHQAYMYLIYTYSYFLSVHKALCLYSLDFFHNFTDIPECLDPVLNQCWETESCIEIEGGYKCSCSPGYYLEHDQRTCSGMFRELLVTSWLLARKKSK